MSMFPAVGGENGLIRGGSNESYISLEASPEPLRRPTSFALWEDEFSGQHFELTQSQTTYRST